jgi:hypothetical protein
MEYKTTSSPNRPHQGLTKFQNLIKRESVSTHRTPSAHKNTDNVYNQNTISVLSDDDEELRNERTLFPAERDEYEGIGRRKRKPVYNDDCD